VPFFAIDRAYGVSGAQSVETFLQALRTAYAAEDASTAR
jgi:predicted DsbA family dithiol-disulfide isomerase